MSRLLVSLLSLAAATGGAAAAHDAISTRTIPAASVADRIGLNVGLGAQYPGSPDYFQGVLIPVIKDLGIHHLRAALPQPEQRPQLAGIKQLSEEGAHVLLTMRLRHTKDSAGDTATTDISNVKAAVQEAGLSAIDGLELPNEYFLHNSEQEWPATLHAFSAQMYRSIHTDPDLKGLIVVGPSVRPDKEHPALPTYADVSDAGNVHAYSENYPLKAYNLQRIKTDHQADMYFPRLPTYMTETGASTATIFTHSVSYAETQQADTIVRELLGGLYDGYRRIYIYNIRDSGQDPKEREQHFGLIRYDNTPKPSYTAVSKLLKTLRAAGPSEGGGAVKGLFTVDGDTKYVQALVFPGQAKTVVAIWRRGPILPETTRTLGHLRVSFEVPFEKAEAVTPGKADPKAVSKTELDLDMVDGPVLITLPAGAGKAAASGRHKGH